MSLIRTFLYRFPRFRTDCPMDLIVGDAVVLGTCLNISESGLRGTFSHPVPAGTIGTLTLYKGQSSVQIEALIYSVKGEEARVRFRTVSEPERVAVRNFIKLLSPA